MSLGDQQWSPTSVQVTVLQARGLRIKGKSGTNDAYAVMQVGKEKFQTSVVEKSVAPVWKEEAAFDLPPLLHGAHGSERGTLHIHVLHRALVGPDKLLGQAVINLPQLSEDKTRSKTEWFKLLDKTGKPDKDRGEVLLDIQFMRNNLTASMFDLSAAGKSRSRLGKFKDKVRGKKKESDSGSNTLPSFTQVLTDSEEEANGGEVAASKDGTKKKHKMKSLFSPKSNLQKNMSQSMSVLPAKNSTLSGSQSSGLNVDSSEGKKKFKFKIHKRSGSSDSKDSSSGLQKQLPVEQSNLCINGSHIYCEEPPTRTSRIGSNFSLASSGHGSMEEVPENSPPSVDSLRAVRQYSPWTEEDEEEVENIKEDESRREEEERMRMEEEEEKARRQQEELERLAEEEERRRVEEQKVKREEEERIRREEEERERLAEEKRRLEEQERRKIEEEEEKRQREEEEKMRMEEERAQEERRRRQEEEEERVRREEEHKIAEEKRRLEEEERRRIEEEERRRREEEERVEEERRQREEEERVRKEKEEYERLMEEQRKVEDEKKRIEAEQRRKMMEEERMRKEEQEKKQREEEERVRKEKEEYERLMEEKRKLEEEKERTEAEGKLRKEEEARVRMEEERKRKEEEEKRRQEEKERIQVEEKRQREEEERIRMEEERMRKQEEEKRQEEEERMKREEEERIKKEELRRQEEEERMRKEKEEYERLMEEKRKVEDEKKRMEAEERIRKEEEKRMEEERMRKEEQDRKQREEEEMRRQEEERVRKEKEEYERLMEEKRKLEEEKERIKAREKLRKEEEERIRMEEDRRREEEEEKRRREEQERIRVEEEERQREEEERRREEEERARKEKEEYERLEKERMKEEEQRRIEEEERIRKKEQERIKMEEEKRRQEEEERARKEKEEIERLAEERQRKKEEEKRRIEEEEKVRRQEEERIRRERKEKEEARRLEKEKLKRDAEEQKKIENKNGQKAAGKKSKLNSSADVCSTNPFDENYSYNPFEEIPDSPPGAKEANVQQRCESAASSLGRQTVSTDEKELISAQREKRPAPQPPGRNQAEKPSQREQDASTRHLGQINTQNKDKEVKTVSVPPQRSVQMIVPVSRSPADSKNGESLTQSSTAKGTTVAGKHSKRPAPPRPRSVEEEPKTTSTAEAKPTVYGLNPFEDDEDENDTDPVCWPPAADKDAASQTKTRSSKVARAPPPPQNNGTLITQNTEGGCVADDTVPEEATNKARDPQPEAINPAQVQESPVQNTVEACVKKEGPPVAARRLQPVKPLNSVEQQSVSVVQGENKSTGIHSEAQDKAKVNDAGLKGPFSQLTQEELISLVLKQENQLSERDKKISELEQYIDNLLVRVIEEQPSILMSMNSLKKAA